MEGAGDIQGNRSHDCGPVGVASATAETLAEIQSIPEPGGS